MTTAKTLSYALNLPLISVDSLAAIAAATLVCNPAVEEVLVAIDAYRGQVFTGTFASQDLLPEIGLSDHSDDSSDSNPSAQHEGMLPDGWTAHPSSVRVVSAEEWEAILRTRPPKIGLAGDGKPLKGFETDLLTRQCDAIGVGHLALRAAIAGIVTNPIGLVPRYLKLSAAEEKAAADENAPSSAE